MHISEKIHWLCESHLYYFLGPLLSLFFKLFYSIPSLPSIGNPPHHPVSQTQLLSDRAVTLVLVRHPLKSNGWKLKFSEDLPRENSGCQLVNISPVKVHTNLSRNMLLKSKHLKGLSGAYVFLLVSTFPSRRNRPYSDSTCTGEVAAEGNEFPI